MIRFGAGGAASSSPVPRVVGFGGSTRPPTAAVASPSRGGALSGDPCNDVRNQDRRRRGFSSFPLRCAVVAMIESLGPVIAAFLSIGGKK
jgi:hypothetical protein